MPLTICSCLADCKSGWFSGPASALPSMDWENRTEMMLCGTCAAYSELVLPCPGCRPSWRRAKALLRMQSGTSCECCSRESRCIFQGDVGAAPLLLAWCGRVAVLEQWLLEGQQAVCSQGLAADWRAAGLAALQDSSPSEYLGTG